MPTAGVLMEAAFYSKVFVVVLGFGYRNLKGEKALLVSNVLPFGASASVYGFHRVAHASHAIGEKLF